MKTTPMHIVDPPNLEEGTSFHSSSTYRLIRRLGQGGMGEVWLADRLSAGQHSQRVAVKFLFDAHADCSLAQEALRMSHLSHDNIVPFVDSGRDAGGRYFVAMSYIDGFDLDGLRAMVGLTPEATYSQEARVRVPDQLVGFILFMVLRALHHAHTYEFDDGAVGLIHRDVSPGNILIDEERGFVKLTDFGVAVRQSTETTKTDIAGKVPFMAPEMLIDRTVDIRSDIYALGIVIYELLTGFNPNMNMVKPLNVIGAITNVMLAVERPLRAPHEVVEGIDPTISAIVTKMLASDPDKRYLTAAAVSADVSRCLFSEGVGPTTASLASYIGMIRHPKRKVTRHDRNALPFLYNRKGDLDIRPKWRLTKEATQEIAAERTPGRVW